MLLAKRVPANRRHKCLFFMIIHFRKIVKSFLVLPVFTGENRKHEKRSCAPGAASRKETPLLPIKFRTAALQQRKLSPDSGCLVQIERDNTFTCLAGQFRQNPSPWVYHHGMAVIGIRAIRRSRRRTSAEKHLIVQRAAAAVDLPMRRSCGRVERCWNQHQLRAAVSKRTELLRKAKIEADGKADLPEGRFHNPQLLAGCKNAAFLYAQSARQ